MYLDANPLIYGVENPTGFPDLGVFLAHVERGEFKLVTSAIIFSEILVVPLRTGNRVLEERYRNLLTPSDTFLIHPVDTSVSVRAAQLRADHGFRTPDAIHIATGLIAGCDFFLTGDTAWARAGIQVVSPF